MFALVVVCCTALLCSLRCVSYGVRFVSVYVVYMMCFVWLWYECFVSDMLSPLICLLWFAMVWLVVFCVTCVCFAFVLCCRAMITVSVLYVDIYFDLCCFDVCDDALL